jgi:hypothetical protein
VNIGVSSTDTGEGVADTASLTFTAADWSIDQTVTVTGVDDDVDDGDQAYSVELANAVSTDGIYNGLDPADVAVLNIDDDAAGFVLTPPAIANTTEAGGTVTFTVKLTSEPLADVNIGDVNIGVSSTDTGEGVADTASLTFTAADWSIDQTVTVTGQDDDVDDGDQAYSIELAAAVSTDGIYNGIDPADVAVLNIDDDAAGFIVSPASGDTTEAGGTATFTVKLTSEPLADVNIGVSSSNTGEGIVDKTTLTFTAGNWSIDQTVTVTGQDDDVDDGDQSYSIELANAVSSDGIYNGLDPADVAVLNINDDTAGFDVTPLAISTTEALGTDTFAVKLTSEPTDTVTVGVSSSNTGEGTVDKTSLTFTSIDWDIEQTVTVTGVNDYVSDSDQSYTIVLTSSSADTVYAGIDPDDVSATNVDDDSPGFLVGTISGNTTEAGGTATFTVELNTQPGANVSVAISSSSTAEGTVSPGILTFTAGIWNSPQTVTVTGVDDDVDDGDQSYTIVLAAATSTDLDYNGLDPSDVSVVNVDNDTAGFDVGAISGDTTEGGGTATFTVKLTSEPLAGVAVGVSSADTGEGVADTASLTFTAADWNIDQTVTVTGVDDDVVDGDQNFSIELAAAVSTDGIYNGLDPADVAVLNMDDDTAGFVVGAISGDTTEGGGTATFTVLFRSLEHRPDGDRDGCG